LFFLLAGLRTDADHYFAIVADCLYSFLIKDARDDLQKERLKA
jgi:hypothetical protein